MTAQKRALIVHGGWAGHTPAESAEAAREMLAGQGVDVTLSGSTSAFADPALDRFDLVVPMITMSTIEDAEVEQLARTVRAGTGLAGMHGLMCDSFRNSPPYQFMTGGQWVAHPGGIVDYTVNVTRPDDPVMEGIDDFAYRSEQYYMHVDPANEVLATTTFDGSRVEEIAGVVMPVVWKRRFGQGRVFFSALGHTAAEFEVSQMRRIFERGLLWAMR